MMPKCLCCGYPISKNDTQDREGVICGVCLMNLALKQDISQLLKPRQAAGHSVNSLNQARSLVVKEC